MALRDFFRRRQTPQEPRRRVAVRSFQAAKIDRLTAGWTTEVVGPDDVVNRNLTVLRARSREQHRNNDYARRFIALLKTNVVGTSGVIVQSTPPDRRGGIDQLAADAVEAAWADWRRRENCDVAGRISFTDMQRLFIGQIGIDGEFLAIEHVRGPWGYQLQLVDPQLLDVEHNTLLQNGNRVRFSIEYDQYDAPVAYYLVRKPNALGSDYAFMGKTYERVEAARVIHEFLPEMVGQRRGLPVMSTALMRMQMLGGYEDAAITAARVGASKMGFFTPPEGSAIEGPTDADGAVITDVSPGTFEQLPEGTQFTPFNPDYPHQQFDAFVKACLRGISSGLGVSYSALSNDLEGVNYSSIRAGVLEDREAWKALQDWMVSVFVRRVFERWAAQATKIGIPIPGTGAWLRDTDGTRYQQADYQPRRWAWVDPQKDTMANILAIQHGLKSRAEVIREQGRDPETVWRELEQERTRLGDLLSLNPMEATEDEKS